MIYAGVDIAKTDHVIGAVDERGAEMCRPMPFKNTEAGLERAVAWLEGLAGSPSDVVVGMEATGHYWMACYSFLVARGYSVAVINPMQVKAVRKLKGLDKVKNDRVDAWLIAEALRIGQYDETRLATDEMASLRSLSRYLQSLRGMAAELKTQCVCLMDAHFPEYAGIFSDMFGAGSRAVLSKSPLPFELARRRADSLARDIAEASRRGGKSAGYAARIKAAARSSIGVRLGQEAASFQVKSLIRQIEFADSECAKVEARVRALLDEVEPLVLTIPGVSYATGAQIVSEIGDVSRFRNASALVSYAGLNSSVSQSGQFGRVADRRTSVQVDVDDDMITVVGNHGGGRVLGVSRGRDAAERCCGYGHGDERLQRPCGYSHFSSTFLPKYSGARPPSALSVSPQVVIPRIRRLKHRIRKTAGNKAPTGARARWARVRLCACA